MPGRPQRFQQPFHRLHSARLVALLWAIFVPTRSQAEAAPILLDGFFGDWTGTVELVDPAGDGGTSGIDFRDVDLANDGDYLFIRFQVAALVGLQATNNLELYLDTDLNVGTGLAVSGIGAELHWQFGARTGRFYRSNGSSVTIFQDDVRLRQLPSVTSSEFEIAIGRDVRPDGSSLLFTGSSMRVLLRDVGTNGDWAPNSGGTLTYTFDAASVPPAAALPLTRTNPTDVRVVTWNTRDLDDFPTGAAAAADRVFSALDPEVICFQELYNASAAQTAAQLESWVPSGAGEAWHGAKVNDCVVVSRFPLLAQWSIDANIAVLLDADAALGKNILLVDAHLPCCTNDSGRQNESDAIMAFFRDATTPGGTVTVPSGTILMLTGDLNLVGDAQQLATLLTGDIVDNGNYGPDFDPDWDGTDLADVVSRQTERRFAYTWRSDTSSFAPGRLDFIIYTDSALELQAHFGLYTPEMSSAELVASGMQAADVTTVSDHLPHVADFRATTSDVAAAGAPGAVRLQGLSSPGAGEVRFAVETSATSRLGVALFDVRGALVATLRSDADGVLPGGTHPFVWDGRRNGRGRAASGAYFLRAVATPLAPAGTGARVATLKVLLVH